MFIDLKYILSRDVLKVIGILVSYFLDKLSC